MLARRRTLFLLAVGWLSACGGGTIHLWQSPAENCDNRVDDDGNGKVDCGDDACSANAACADLQTEIPAPEFDVCGESVGDRSQFPVDMIWLLDSSVSMERELSWIANNLNHMDGFLQEKRANVRVVLLGGPDICIAPPLGGPGCTDGERFMHIREKIGNQEALRMGVDLYPKFKNFLRQGAKRAIVAVSDDNPNPALTPDGWPNGVTAETFRGRLLALDPAFSDVVFHSIVAFAEDGGHQPRGCASAQRLGQTYLALTEETGGLKFSVCNNRQGDWQDFLDQLATSVAGMVDIPCSFPRVLTLKDDKQTNPAEIFGQAEVDGRWQPLTQVPDAQSCTDELGFYVASEQELRACPTVCSSLKVNQVRFKYGCPIGIAPD